MGGEILWTKVKKENEYVCRERIPELDSGKEERLGE